jgi:mono/diheme cytochrome c family protein
MNNPRMVLAMLGLACLGVALPGCQRQAAPRFVSSDEVLALTAGLDSEEGLEGEEGDPEDLKFWRELQKQIVELLEDRCGTPLAPKMLSVSAGSSESGASESGAPDGGASEQNHLKRGAQVFMRRCQACHGVSGDGNGPVANYMNPRPRDYRQGIFKFTTTPYGSMPRRTDIVKTLKRGVTGTSMPSFQELAKEDLDAVADYVIMLAKRGQLESQLVLLAEEEEELDEEFVQEIAEEIATQWQTAQRKLVMPVSKMPEMTAETVAKGHEIFLSKACSRCHGKDGRGGSMGKEEVGKDAWGYNAAAADLTSGMFHGGGHPIDIYRRIYSGINGTPMPAFDKLFAEDPDAIWYLVHYIKDLGEFRRRGQAKLEGTADGY